jgi:methyl-accepting chemotaxis protein
MAEKKELKAGTKLLLSFFSLIAVTLVVGVFSIGRLASVYAVTDEIAGNRLPSVQTASNIRYCITCSDIAEKEYRPGIMIPRGRRRRLCL